MAYARAEHVGRCAAAAILTAGNPEWFSAAVAAIRAGAVALPLNERASQEYLLARSGGRLGSIRRSPPPARCRSTRRE